MNNGIDRAEIQAELAIANARQQQYASARAYKALAEEWLPKNKQLEPDEEEVFRLFIEYRRSEFPGAVTRL